MAGTRPPAVRRWFSAFLPSAREPEAVPTRFLDPAALAQPAAALALVAREQLEVAQGLPHYLNDIREETRGQGPAPVAAQHQRTAAILKQVTRFTAKLAERTTSAASAPDTSRLNERTELLLLLSDTLRELADTMSGSLRSAALSTLIAAMAEGLHVVLLSAVDAIESPDQLNLEMLHHLTADRGELMEGIRRSLLRGAHTLTIEEHQALFTSTGLFERIILLLRQLQLSLASGPR